MIPVAADSDFPLQNLPFGVGCRPQEPPELLARLGNYAIRCEALRQQGRLGEGFESPLVDILSLDLPRARRLRTRLRELADELMPGHSNVTAVDELQMRAPCRIPAFVDFYSGIHHASNVGRMFRPDMPPLLPNYRHLPVAYNGRASTIVPSGTPIRRPRGQYKGAHGPEFGPSQELDFELEVGFFLAEGNAAGEPIEVGQAERRICGLVLVNDWSARDLQRWEYQPLGPFLAKSFATSISPWVVPLEALEPFRVVGQQDPPPLPHLARSEPALYDIELEVSIQSRKMTQPQIVARSNTKQLYWSFGQQLAHQTSNGTRVEPGDLYASGTISGPDPGSFGSLLETTWRGSKPIVLEETGESRTFLEDGDTVRFRAWAQGDGYRIGFGELVGEVAG